MDDELRSLLKEIIAKLAAIEDNTDYTSYVKGAVEDVQREIKELREVLEEK